MQGKIYSAIMDECARTNIRMDRLTARSSPIFPTLAEWGIGVAEMLLSKLHLGLLPCVRTVEDLYLTTECTYLMRCYHDGDQQQRITVGLETYRREPVTTNRQLMSVEKNSERNYKHLSYVMQR